MCPRAVLVIIVFAAGCGTVSETVRVATHTQLTLPNAAPNPALVDKHCPFGAPRKLPALGNAPRLLVTREAYALEHDAAAKIALWVCASLEPVLVFGDAKRKDKWLPDPDVDARTRAVDADYSGAGYHRGHMVASEDRVASQALNDATFFLSNAVPQDGPLNSGQWARLEATIRSWVQTRIVHDAKMITGGFFYDPAEDDPRTADGLVPFKQIGRNKVAVPTHVFKVVVARDSTNRWQAIAFVAQNKRPSAGWSFSDGIVAIDWLEVRAGLDLLPDLDPAEELRLESKPASMWRP